MKKRKQHKISMLAMEKLIEDLYKPYQDAETGTKDVPKDIETDVETDNYSELY